MYVFRAIWFWITNSIYPKICVSLPPPIPFYQSLEFMSSRIKVQLSLVGKKLEIIQCSIIFDPSSYLFRT